ncbi:MULTISPECIES: hypothetical protein [Mycolicibacterium]|mgnify:CR=1 FL=1|uniref:hypothetical protein n=1 Tax=Mycolicibacterium TaxID=1866885 RepID=UPI000CF92FA8|nr:hypothetical protein [Mycolicibacterium austroafricanum]PQP41782.1 hypothetical protein C6A88_27625 [Mycolicibacterium austroafricanum]
MSGEYDDELEHVLAEVTRPRQDYDPEGDGPPPQPLCRQCVRDLPADDSGLCAFCKVVSE